MYQIHESIFFVGTICFVLEQKKSFFNVRTPYLSMTVGILLGLNDQLCENKLTKYAVKVFCVCPPYFLISGKVQRQQLPSQVSEVWTYIHFFIV